MTILKGLATVSLAAIGFGVAGAGIGYLIGVISPEYYRLVFRAADFPHFNSGQMGLAAGLAQGVTTGVVAGLGVVLLVTWYEVRRLAVPHADERRS